MAKVMLSALEAFKRFMIIHAENHAIQQRAKNDSLRAWGMRFCPHLLRNPSSCPLHDALNVELEELRTNRGRKINIIAPRGYAKSTWIRLKILKAMCEGSERFILYIVDTGPQAERELAAIREELETNLELRKVYPLACSPGTEWNKGTLVTASGVCISAFGTGKGVRGLKFRQWRPTLIILDDPDNDEDVLSPTKRAKNLEWFHRALMQCGHPLTNFAVVGTALHRDCIVMNLTKAGSGFRTIMFKAVPSMPARMDLWDEWENLQIHGQMVKTEEGTITYESAEADAFYAMHHDALHLGAVVQWPEHETLHDLMKMRAVNHGAFMSEKQNDPRDPNKCEFKEEWFNEEDGGAPVWYNMSELAERLAKEQHVTVVYSDPATGGATKKHDYSAVIQLHYFGDPWCYVEVNMERMPINELVDLNIEIAIHNKPAIVAFEENAFQQLIGDQILARANDPAAPEMQCPWIGQVLQGVKNFGVKNTRISRLAPWFKRRFYRFQRQDSHTALLMQQILEHPHADHDDGPDALEGATTALTNNFEIGTTTSVGFDREGDVDATERLL